MNECTFVLLPLLLLQRPLLRSHQLMLLAPISVHAVTKETKTKINENSENMFICLNQSSRETRYTYNL